jgi:hypothetical protein
VSWLCVLTVALVALPAPASSAESAVVLKSPDGCLGSDVAAKLDAVLLENQIAPESITVAAQSAQTQDGRSAVTLRAIDAQGKLLFERQYTLSGSECASAAAMLASVLAQHVEALPQAHATPEGPSKPPPAPPEPPPLLPERAFERTPVQPATLVTPTSDDERNAGLALHQTLHLGASVRAVPWGADLELGTRLLLGVAPSFAVLGAAVQLGLPQEVGNGRFWDTEILLQVGYCHRWPWLTVIGLLQVGALVAAGLDYANNFVRTGFWLELSAAALFRLGRFELGPHVGVAPLDYRVIEGAGGAGAERELSRLRFGVSVAWALY